jgi:F-type H+-transporting ATPase subunit b
MATTTTETTAATEHAAKPGMPQLDTSTWPSQLFWLAITFVALYIVISRVAIPRTGGVIEKRKATIDGDLAAAQKAKAESEKAAQAHEASLAEARGKANTIAADNRNTLNAELDGEKAKLDASLAAKIADAEKKIATARGKAMAGVEAMAADIAQSIVGELTGAKVTKADAASAVAKAAK